MTKKVPKFKSEAAERKFWGEHDSTEYVDWDDAKCVVLPNLNASQRTISLRLPAMMLAELKRLANKRDVPYQLLLKMFLADRLARKRGGRARDNWVGGLKAGRPALGDRQQLRWALELVQL